VFSELGVLMPGYDVDLTLVVRADMLGSAKFEGWIRPLTCEGTPSSTVRVQVVGGTYCEGLDPIWIEGGKPDLVVACNAGIFAYDSWTSCVGWLLDNNVVSVLTDYNEHSGLHCSAVGGGMARASLCLNPFRSPRAMPVQSMNLPQFSNSFMYCYNQQFEE